MPDTQTAKDAAATPIVRRISAMVTVNVQMAIMARPVPAAVIARGAIASAEAVRMARRAAPAAATAIANQAIATSATRIRASKAGACGKDALLLRSWRAQGDDSGGGNSYFIAIDL